MSKGKKLTALTERQMNFFRQTGFLRLSEQISDDYITKIKVCIENNIKNEISPFRKNANGEVSRLDQLISRDPLFLEVIRSPQLLEPLQSLLGPNIELTLNRHNHATINSKGDNPVRLHRDVLQWSRTVVTAIIYLEEATCENGCTYIIPSSHYFPFVGTPNNGGTWMDEHSIYSDLIDQAVPIPMHKGGILLFDSLAFHTAGLNNTDETRMSITFAFHSVDELAGIHDDQKRILILGERLYRGNDK